MKIRGLVENPETLEVGTVVLVWPRGYSFKAATRNDVVDREVIVSREEFNEIGSHIIAEDLDLLFTKHIGGKKEHYECYDKRLLRGFTFKIDEDYVRNKQVSDEIKDWLT